MNGDEFLDFLAELEEMDSDEERFREIFKIAEDAYQEEMAKRNNEDYEVDPEMMGHFTDFAGFMAKIAQKSEGNRCEISFDEPKAGGGDVVAYFVVFSLNQSELIDFCKFFVWATSVSVDSLLDGTICFSVRFTNLYRKKEGV